MRNRFNSSVSARFYHHPGPSPKTRFDHFTNDNKQVALVVTIFDQGIDTNDDSEWSPPIE
jgi:hypothetical protein